MMRIHVANPNSTAWMTETIARSAREAAGPGTEIRATTNASGPASIEGPVDGARAVPGLLDLVLAAEAEAHVVACFDDTGLEAARMLTRRPVVGIGEAACLVATQLAHRFVVVTAVPVSVPVIEGNLARTGLAARCAGVRSAGVAVLDIASHGSGDDPVAAAVRRAAREVPGAAIVLGCAGMAALARHLSAELDRPVVDGVAAGVTLAEGLARTGLGTAR